MEPLKVFFIIALAGLLLEFIVFGLLDKVVQKPLRTNHRIGCPRSSGKRGTGRVVYDKQFV